MTAPTGLAALGKRVLDEAVYQQIQRDTLPPGLAALGPRVRDAIPTPIVEPEPDPVLPVTVDTQQLPVTAIRDLLASQPERFEELVALEDLRPLPRVSALQAFREFEERGERRTLIFDALDRLEAKLR